MVTSVQTKAKVRDFSTEACMVECFVGSLQAGRTVFGSVQVATEWDHRSGLVDVLARNGAHALIAFEAKLTDWRRAFLQAYRNTAYANRVFVLLPEKTVHRALREREEFEFRGVGLCSFDGNEVKILIDAVEQDPLLRWLRVRAHEHFNALPDECPSRPKRSRNRAVPAPQF